MMGDSCKCYFKLWVMLTGVNSDWSWVEKYFKDKRSVTSDKSSDAAAEFRVAGNKHFHKKDFKTALQYYNQVVYLLFVQLQIYNYSKHLYSVTHCATHHCTICHKSGILKYDLVKK